MRTIRTKVYQFSELSESAKQTAIYNYIRYAPKAREMTPDEVRELFKLRPDLYEFKADGTRF